MIKGAIFDMDGTLLESMGMWHDAGARYLREIGIEAGDDLGDKTFCMTIPIAAEFVRDEFDLGARGLSVEDVIDGINAPAREFYRSEAEPKPGAEKLLKDLHEAGIPIIIGTSSAREFVELAMTRLGVMEYITDIISCADIGKTKADPLLFNLAAEKMGSKPDETWVFEDGLYAIKTAVKHGFKTVGLYDEVSADDWDEIQEITTVSAIDCAHVDLSQILGSK